MADDTVYTVIQTVDTSTGGPTSSFFEKDGVVTTVGSSTPDNTAYVVADALQGPGGSPTSSFYEKGVIYQAIDLGSSVLDTVAANAASAAASAAAAAVSLGSFSTLLTAEALARSNADALLAPLASPGFSGVPTAPTAAPGVNTLQLSTTAFTNAAVAVEASARATAVSAEATARSNADALLAPLASPALTGTPTAPTQAALLNSTAIANTAFVYAATRDKLTSSRNYFVLKTGSDSNNGLTNTAGGAFLTIGKAVAVACACDLALSFITINVGPGTYNEAVNPAKLVGGGSLSIIGDTTTPSNVIVNNTVGFGCFNFANTGTFVLAGFKLTSAGGNAAGVTVFNPGTYLQFYALDFGNCGSFHIWANFGGTVQCIGNYTISGPANYHLLGQQNCAFDVRSYTVTFTTNTTAFAGAFLSMSACCSILTAGVTYTNKAFATGARYISATNSAIDTAGGGATYLPGTVAGTATTGLYV